uniref:Derlin n=1 Tax=Moniliophthora roreri TaxID=221103 RepID=A0A0W0FSV5_MONRR
MESVLSKLRNIPPVTRFLTLSLIGITGTSLLNLVSAYKLIYVQRFVFSKFEFWRLYTSFFLGSYGVTLLFPVT